MYFKRLEIHGFKSFAEPAVIEFHPGITCIVGPNGSGKSNISDAVRWVLGEQSPRALRGGRMEEVIFSGTESRRSRGMAEVTLVIDNSSGILHIDYGEVAVTRRMYRSGESEYLINNNRCRLRDIRELIMDTGIGVEGYSVIGQGKIADIIGSKPENRREIFEEAAGIAFYKNKRAETERKLESASDNLDRVNDIISGIESRLSGLKEESDRAGEFLSLKEKYRDLEVNIILKNIENLLSKDQIYKEEISRTERQIKEGAAEKTELAREAEEKSGENGRLEHLAGVAGDKLIKIAERISESQKQREIGRERLAGIKREALRLEGEIGSLEEKLERELKNKEELNRSLEETMLRRKNADADLTEKAAELDRLREEVRSEANRTEEKRERLFELQSLISSKKSVVKSYESIKTALAERMEQMEQEAAGAKKNDEESVIELKRAQDKLMVLNDSLSEISARLGALMDEKERLVQRRELLHRQAEEKKLLVGQRSSRKKAIEEMERGHEGYDHAVRYIMKAGLPGIKGVAADLMEVPKGLETAVETALGGQMQNIVCDTDADAKRAIKLLREKGAGRLTFLPKASIRGTRARIDPKISGSPSCLGLGADCVSFEKEYENIFAYLLGRVVIVKDMDSALAFSKIEGRTVRFVTLEGEVINGNGAITGGRYKNRTANLLGRKGEIRNLGREIGELKIDLSNILKEQDDLTRRLKDMGELEESMAEDKHKKELEEASLKSGISSLEAALSAIRGGRERYDKEYDLISEEMADAENMTRSAAREIEKSEKEILSLQKDIEESLISSGDRRSRLEEISDQVTKAKIAARDLENKEGNCRQLLSRVSDAAEDYEDQIRGKKTEREKLEKERSAVDSRDSEGASLSGELLEEKKKAEDNIRSLSERRTELTGKINRLGEEIREINDRINDCRDGKHQAELKSARLGAQIDSLKERLWNEFEISYAQAKDLRRDDFVMSSALKESRAARERLRELGDVNVGSIREYGEVSRRCRFLTGQRDDILQSVDGLKRIIKDTDGAIRRKFKANFTEVAKNFDMAFKELFGGGYAELRLEDESLPLQSGIGIVAQPPGKKLQNISLMSGGEKTMTAIALMFAILKAKPTPFCILDEVEASLDDDNIERFINYLRKFSGIQFTLVTHQKATMKHADALYGVTMAERGVSKVLSLRLGDDFEL